MSLFTRAFLLATLERALKTFAQAAAALLVAGTAVGLVGVDFVSVVSVAGLAALVSILTSVASSGTSGAGPSLATETVDIEDGSGAHRATGG